MIKTLVSQLSSWLKKLSKVPEPALSSAHHANSDELAAHDSELSQALEPAQLTART